MTVTKPSSSGEPAAVVTEVGATASAVGAKVEAAAAVDAWVRVEVSTFGVAAVVVEGAFWMKNNQIKNHEMIKEVVVVGCVGRRGKGGG